MHSLLRGTLSNGLAGVLLFAVSRAGQLEVYAVVALGVQWAVFFLHGLPKRSEALYDLSGSATHLAVVCSSLVSSSRARTPRQILCAVASIVWLTRLGTFLYVRIAKDGKDGRFDDIKKSWLTFLGAWTIQALWVLLIQAPVLLINDADDRAPASVVDVVAAACWVVGFGVEFMADVQKFAFRADPANRHAFITTGMWRYSRHPNYFGELLMWLAVASSVAAAGWRQPGGTLLGRYQLAWLSPAFTATLLLGVSGLPMVEAAGRKKWGGQTEYEHYMANTSSIAPWFPAPTVRSSAGAGPSGGLGAKEKKCVR